MPPRNRFRLREVEPGIDVGGHASVQEINDYPPGWSWLEIEGPDRGGRVHDHHRGALTRRFLRNPLGEELRTLIVADHVLESDRRVLRANASVRNSKCADRAGVHNPSDLCAHRASDQI